MNYEVSNDAVGYPRERNAPRARSRFPGGVPSVVAAPRPDARLAEYRPGHLDPLWHYRASDQGAESAQPGHRGHYFLNGSQGLYGLKALRLVLQERGITP
jgi:hypothetical protein